MHGNRRAARHLWMVEAIRLLSRRQVTVRIGLAIALVQMLTVGILFTLVLNTIGVPDNANLVGIAFFSVVFLTALSTPLIYRWVIKPFVVARDAAIARLREQATTDPLTGLANRRLIADYLGRALASSLREERYGALLIMDLNGFKCVNDGYGHGAGDALLVEIARRIQSAVRAEDVCGRLGGDEFVVVMGNIGETEQVAHDNAVKIGRKLADTISKPYGVSGNHLCVTAGVGIRIFGAGTVDVETVMHQADRVMYRAKGHSGGGVVVFSDR